MTRDQDRVKHLQQCLGNWNPDGRCEWHEVKHCEYDKLGQLIKLHLCELKVAQVPSEAWQFLSLQELGLSNNQLSTLPGEIGQLSSLQRLYLDCGKLNTLPVEIGQLSSLRKLDLSDNLLSALPTDMRQLSSLRELDLNRNVFPSETLVQGIVPRSILATSTRALSPTPPAILATSTQVLLPMKIFYCYAHEDKDLRDQIDKHLGVLKRLGQITGWYDREIQAGTEWEREIESNLNTANIILLLVSADFVNSDYCYGVEMQKALELHRIGKAYVLPILLRPVYWQGAPFAELQMLPTGAKPITEWANPDKALEDVARTIHTVANSLRAQKST